MLGVSISPDLRQAEVRVSALGDDESREGALNGLKHASGYIRRELAHNLPLRRVPELCFRLDNSWKHVARIDRLLEQLNQDGSN